jgi:hypothetical protein
MNSLGSSNPTSLKVGHEGVIFGQRAKVVGRSVLTSKDGYRWNEYHLNLADGKDPTLVCESGIWKRFALFEPETTMSAEVAAGHGVGDQVALWGRSARIDYVGESRVAYIEGKAPEGYRVGSEAHYFNAEDGNTLFVVSWTGDEVEFYEGQNLPRGEVERAFGLPNPSLLARIFSGGSGGLDSWLDDKNRLVGTILGACALLMFLFFRGGGTSEPTLEPPPPVPATAQHLAVETQGDLAGHHYVVAGHQVSEIAETRGTFDRHEYDLVDELGGHALLVQGLSWNARQWYLLQPTSNSVTLWPATQSVDLRPNQAATLAPGFVLGVEDRRPVIRTLFRCRTLGSDGQVPPRVWTGSVRYGFTAQDNDEWVLARWDESDLEIQVGRILTEQEVQHAFGTGISR